LAVPPGVTLELAAPVLLPDGLEVELLLEQALAATARPAAATAHSIVFRLTVMADSSAGGVARRSRVAGQVHASRQVVKPIQIMFVRNVDFIGIFVKG
jgi:hypothetical protein